MAENAHNLLISMTQEQEWVDLYKPFLTVGSLWRSDRSTALTCRITEISPRRVEAFYIKFDDEGEQLVRSHRDTFLCSTGIFLRQFSPADQIVAARVASAENIRAVLAARRDAIRLCKQAVAQRLSALASALQGEGADLLQRIDEILATEIDQQTSMALVQWQPPEPRLIEKQNGTDG